MALTPLSSDQEAAIARLVSARRVEQVPADLNRASVFLEQAENTLADIENVTIAQNKYSLAYNAGHAAGQALLAAYGYRTTNQAGHHAALIRFMGIVLSEADDGEAVNQLERMRRARNRFQYEAGVLPEAEAVVAAATARHIVAAVRDRGIE